MRTAAITPRITKLDSFHMGILLICLASFVWALTEIIIQHIPGGYSLYQVVWVRYATHILFMLLVFAPRYGMKLVTTRRLGLQLLRAVMMLIMPVSFILAVNHMSVGNIFTLFWLSPLMIIVLSWVLLKEKVSWVYYLISVIGLVGIAILSHPNRSFDITGVILSLAMGLSFSLYLVMTRMLRDEPILTSLFYTAVGVLVPLSARLSTFWKPLTLHSGLLMALVGLLGFVLLWLLDKGLEMISSAVSAPYLYSEMFWLIILRLITRIL